MGCPDGLQFGIFVISTSMWLLSSIPFCSSDASWGKGMTVEAGGSLNFFSGCLRNSYSLLAGTGFQSENFCHSALYLFSSLSNLNSINIWVFLITTENSYADLLLKNFNWRGHMYTYSWFALLYGRNQHKYCKAITLQLKFLRSKSA